MARPLRTPLNELKENINLIDLADQLPNMERVKGKGSNAHNAYFRFDNAVYRITNKNGRWLFTSEKGGDGGSALDLVAMVVFGNQGVKVDYGSPAFNQSWSYLNSYYGGANIQTSFVKKESAPVKEERKELLFRPQGDQDDVFSHPYLDARKISPDVYNHPAFKGRLGKFAEVTDKIGYAPSLVAFPPLVVPYYDERGKVISKEFKNIYSEEGYKKRKSKDDKMSFSRVMSGTYRGEALWSSNVSADQKITHLFVGESPIDILSYFQAHYQLKGYEHLAKSTLFVSGGGMFTIGQYGMIQNMINKYAQPEHPFTLIFGGDNDKMGRIYNLTMMGLLQHPNAAPNDVTFSVSRQPEAGVSVSFQNTEIEKVTAIAAEIKQANLQGGVRQSGTVLNFYFTLENYVKAGRILFTHRQSVGQNTLAYMLARPDGYKDWNDLLKDLSTPIEEKRPAYIPLQDQVPVKDYLSSFLGFQSNGLNITAFNLEPHLTGSDYPYINLLWRIDTFSNTKDQWMHGKLAGVFRLDTLTFKPEQSFERAFASETNDKLIKQAQKDIFALEFYFDELHPDRQGVKDMLTRGFSIDHKDNLLKDGEVMGKIVKGRIETDGADFTDGEYNSLDLLQELNAKGLYPSGLLRKEGVNLFLGQQPVFRMGGQGQLIDIGAKLLSPELKDLAFTQKEILEESFPTTVIRSLGDERILTIKDGRVTYGKSQEQIAFYDEEANTMTLLDGMGERITQQIHDHLSMVVDLGYDKYRRKMNAPLRIRVSLPDEELLLDGVKVGSVEKGKLVISAESLTFELIGTLNDAQVPESFLRIKKDGLTHPFHYIPSYWQEQENLPVSEKGKFLYIENVMVGAKLRNDTKFSIFPYVPDHPVITKSLLSNQELVRVEAPIKGLRGQAAPLHFENMSSEEISIMNIQYHKEKLNDLNFAKWQQFARDPKWEGLIEVDGDDFKMVGYKRQSPGYSSLIIGKEHPMLDEESTIHFVASNALPVSNHKEVLIFESIPVMLDWYDKQRDKIIYNDSVDFIALTNKSDASMKVAFCAGLLGTLPRELSKQAMEAMPNMIAAHRILLVGSDEFKERISVVTGQAQESLKKRKIGVQFVAMDKINSMEPVLNKPFKEASALAEQHLSEGFILNQQKGLVHFPIFNLDTVDDTLVFTNGSFGQGKTGAWIATEHPSVGDVFAYDKTDKISIPTAIIGETPLDALERAGRPDLSQPGFTPLFGAISNIIAPYTSPTIANAKGFSLLKERLEVFDTQNVFLAGSKEFQQAMGIVLGEQKKYQIMYDGQISEEMKDAVVVDMGVGINQVKRVS